MSDLVERISVAGGRPVLDGAAMSDLVERISVAGGRPVPGTVRP
jgi:hypothetical protein